MLKYISCIMIMLPLHIFAASAEEDKPASQPTNEMRFANGIERIESSDKIIYRKGTELCTYNKKDQNYTHTGPATVPFPVRRFVTLKKQFEESKC